MADENDLQGTGMDSMVDDLAPREPYRSLLARLRDAGDLSEEDFQSRSTQVDKAITWADLETAITGLVRSEIPTPTKRRQRRELPVEVSEPAVVAEPEVAPVEDDDDDEDLLAGLTLPSAVADDVEEVDDDELDDDEFEDDDDELVDVEDDELVDDEDDELVDDEDELDDEVADEDELDDEVDEDLDEDVDEVADDELDDDDDLDDDDEPVAASAAAKKGEVAKKAAAKKAPAKKAPAKKSKKTPKRPTAVAAPERTGPITFIGESIEELRKVVYPTSQQLGTYFVVVLVFVLFIIAFTFSIDLGLGRLMLLVFG